MSAADAYGAFTLSTLEDDLTQVAYLIQKAVKSFEEDRSLQKETPENAFKIGYTLAKGINSIVTATSISINAFGSHMPSQWKQATQTLIKSLNEPHYDSSPSSVLSDQAIKLLQLREQIKILGLSLRKLALATDSESLISESEYNNLLP